MARSAVADGIRVLAATPHVRDDYPTSPGRMESALEELRLAVAEAGIELELLPGGELALEHLARLEPAELRRFGLGGDDFWVLLEFPYDHLVRSVARTLLAKAPIAFGLAVVENAYDETALVAIEDL